MEAKAKNKIITKHFRPDHQNGGYSLHDSAFDRALAEIEAQTKRELLEGLEKFIGEQPQKFNYTELENDYNELSKEITRQLKDLEGGN